MNRSGWFTRRPNVWVLALLVIAPSVMIVSRSTSVGPGPAVGQTIFLIVLAVVAVVLVIQVGRMLAGHDPDVPRLVERLASDPDQRRLLERWMGRARWARNLGGLCGLLVWLFGTRTTGDLLLCGVGGIALGAMVAELHHVGPQRGTRTAMLDVRSVDDYLMDDDRRRMIGVGGAAVLLAGAGLLVGDALTTVACAASALTVLALARLVQSRVAARPRPAIAARIRRADDLARELAIGRGLARPATFFGLALIARGAFELGDRYALFALVGVAAWVYALYMWWNNRRLGLDFVVEREQPLLA